MTAPRPPLDPDPRHVDADDLWDPQAGAWVPRQSAVVVLVGGLVMGAILGFLFAIAIVHAAPRPAATVIPTDATKGTAERLASSGNPSQPTGAPHVVSPTTGPNLVPPAAAAADDGGGAPTPAVERGSAIEAGTLAFADPGLGDRYLAIPSGPGHHVRICAGHRCIDRVSTDAGPALFRQREGRIADVSFVDFAYLCACKPRTIGLIAGTITYLEGSGATPPPTETEP